MRRDEMRREQRELSDSLREQREGRENREPLNCCESTRCVLCVAYTY